MKTTKTRYLSSVSTPTFLLFPLVLIWQHNFSLLCFAAHCAAIQPGPFNVQHLAPDGTGTVRMVLKQQVQAADQSAALLDVCEVACRGDSCTVVAGASPEPEPLRTLGNSCSVFFFCL